MTGLGWAGLVCGFVGSWVALGFVWVSFPRAISEGFSLSRLTAGVELRSARVEVNARAVVILEKSRRAVVLNFEK